MENTPKGSISWNLCRKGLKVFTQNIYQFSGNGRQTFMWDDKINGNAPLNYDISINEIKSWLINKGVYKLSNIILWDPVGN